MGRIEQLMVIARGARHARAQAERDRWPRERREALARERLTELVAYAREHSPYYREALADYDPQEGPASLPVLDKATMMERFEDIVCDRRLRRDPLLAHVETLQGDEFYLGCYRAMTTSGSSGRKGLFVFDREGWASVVGLFLYFSAIAGTRPRLPRLRVAAIGGASPAHMSRRGASTLDVGMHRMLSLPVTLPMPKLVDALNRFEPDYLNVYPSMAVLLAEEQRAGRLRLNLRTMSTSSELRTPEMTARIAEAFGVQPFDLYATTEGLWASDCECHDGLHLMEDGVIAENADADGRPVSDGEPGARLLVTNLTNRVQPPDPPGGRRRRHADLRALRVRAHAAAHPARRRPRGRHHVAPGDGRSPHDGPPHAVRRRRPRSRRRRVPGRAGGHAHRRADRATRRRPWARDPRARRPRRAPRRAWRPRGDDRRAAPRGARAFGRRQASDRDRRAAREHAARRGAHPSA
jgi:phenylacetate-coenzyme A ligase PaaK-like adenylate-forming protein